MRPMHNLLFACSTVLAIGVSTHAAQEGSVPVGAQITKLQFKDIRYLYRSLEDFGEKKAFVLVFTNTTCPLVQRYMPRLKELDSQYGPRGVQFVAVNCGLEDSIANMAEQAIEFGALFPFVKDMDGSCVTALGVERTPEVVILSPTSQLLYRGRIDDQYRVGGSRPSQTRGDLEEAIKEVLAGKPVTVTQTPVDGCKITLPSKVKPNDEVTFAEHVLPLMQKHCQDCHHKGTAAPFALMSYSEVASQGEMLAEVVAQQSMPPWYASPNHGKFRNDPSLSREARELIVRWVETGMKEGDMAKAPPAKEYEDTEWAIGKPDLVVTMSQVHDVQADGYVPYHYVILPYVFVKETWLEAIEILPKNRSVVHHCNMAYGSIGGGAGKQTFITGYVPGGQPMDLSHFGEGVAFRIPAGSVLGLQIHYTTTGKPEKSQISVGLRYPRGVVKKQTHHVILDTGRIAIAPGHPAYRVSDDEVLKHDVTLLGMFCHMHVRGKDMTFLAHYPDGKTETLLRIPNYNFEWQLGYELDYGTKQLPKGTRLESVAHYDNSPFNPYNPDPNRVVPYGQQTYDEMLNGFVFFTHDDENLNLTIDPKNGTAVSAEGIASNGPGE